LAVDKHFTIPIFIPQVGCPHQCVFCDQQRISGKRQVPGPEEVSRIILRNLETIPEENAHVEIGFFGGSFTGLDRLLQREYLSVAARFLHPASRIRGIRISTRPDYIDRNRLLLLREYGVTTVELGAQSMDEEVLKKSGRGHTVTDTINASRLIREMGFSLGLQMMVGLPGDTIEKSDLTARTISRLGANCARIYPTLVIKGTALAAMYLKGDYRPLEQDEAVQWCATALRILEGAGVRVIRVGLPPSEGLLAGNDLLAGPFHPSFRELVETALWKDEFKELLSSVYSGPVTIHVGSGQFNVAIGHRASNKKILEEKFSRVAFRKDEVLNGRSYYVDYH
jgi:histone acetyltransferase (RNA polymerase elongator complex component)